MPTSWKDCKKILVMRPDNMGDVLMSEPAIRALKQTFGCHITLLTSGMAAPIVPYITAIDEVLECNLPWVKTSVGGIKTHEEIQEVTDILRQGAFDGVIVFTVCSQNPMPSVMLAYMAGIPLRLAYCRENPYNLLTHWQPDQEPYTFIRHQVQRDLDLAASIGAQSSDDRMTLQLPADTWLATRQNLASEGIDATTPLLVLHAPVSEKKREYDVDKWIAAGRQLRHQQGFQILLTGTAGEAALVQCIQQGIGTGAYNLAGKLPLQQFISLIQHAAVVVSVNTATIHIAAAVQTPVVVLYARTNPQHTPWKVANRVLYFPVNEALQSKNEVVKFLQTRFPGAYTGNLPAAAIAAAVHELVTEKERL